MVRMLCVLTAGLWLAQPGVAEVVHSGDVAKRGLQGNSVPGQSVVASLPKNFSAQNAGDLALQVSLANGQQFDMSRSNAVALQQAVTFIQQYIQTITVACLSS